MRWHAWRRGRGGLSRSSRRHKRLCMPLTHWYFLIDGASYSQACSVWFVLFWSQDAPSWECHGVAHAHARACCGVHRNPHAATHCTDPICQLPRPDIPQVGSFELRDMLPWRQPRL